MLLPHLAVGSRSCKKERPQIARQPPGGVSVPRSLPLPALVSVFPPHRTRSFTAHRPPSFLRVCSQVLGVEALRSQGARDPPACLRHSSYRTALTACNPSYRRNVLLAQTSALPTTSSANTSSAFARCLPSKMPHACSSWSRTWRTRAPQPPHITQIVTDPPRCVERASLRAFLSWLGLSASTSCTRSRGGEFVSGWY